METEVQNESSSPIIKSGFTRKMSAPISSNLVIKPIKLTLEVGSRWYKAPELLFGCKVYDYKIDLWSVGCIIAELFMRAAIT